MATKQQRSRAASKRAAANVDREEIINALKSEKAGYEQRGLADRAKAVQSEISKHQAAAKKAGTSSDDSKDDANGSAAKTPSSSGRTNRGSAKPAAGGDDKAKGDEKPAGDKSAGADASGS